jgi:hypothetical protein
LGEIGECGGAIGIFISPQFSRDKISIEQNKPPDHQYFKLMIRRLGLASKKDFSHLAVAL